MSETHNSEFWHDWQPGIKLWLEERQTNGGKRTNHALIGAGRIPE